MDSRTPSEPEFVLIRHPTESWARAIKVIRATSDNPMTWEEQLLLALQKRIDALELALAAAESNAADDREVTFKHIESLRTICEERFQSMTEQYRRAEAAEARAREARNQILGEIERLVPRGQMGLKVQLRQAINAAIARGEQGREKG